MSTEYLFPGLHVGQKEVHGDPARFKVLACGRRRVGGKHVSAQSYVSRRGCSESAPGGSLRRTRLPRSGGEAFTC